MDIRSSIRLFADDTGLYIIVDNPDYAAQLLNADLENITNWAETWLVKFKTDKTESLLFSRKTSGPTHPPIKQNPFFSHVKQVGLHILQFLCLIKT